VTTRRQTEKELRQRLNVLIGAIIGLVALMFLSFTFFAPAIGSVFGFLSKYRNQDTSTKINPNPPLLSEVPNATKEKQITIRGYSQEGMVIKLFVNGPEKAETVTGTDGMFTFDNVGLIKGRNLVFAKAVDSNNAESEKSETHVVNVDTEDPKIVIASPAEGEVVKNLNKRIKVEGTLNEEAVVKINGQTAIVKPDFSFEGLIGVDEGDVEIKIVATDEAGNEEEAIIFVKYEKKSS
jgi:hypothetical protein